MVDGDPAALVAVVDDDPSVRTALLGLLRAAELAGRAFASAEEFLGSTFADEARCLVTDIRMPGLSGIALQSYLTIRRPWLPIIFITAHGDAATCQRVLDAGALRVFQKPFDDDALLETIRAALRR